jgi:hypothetical protein
MSDMNDRIIALNVRLKPSESAAHPRATNYTNIAVAQVAMGVDVLARLHQQIQQVLVTMREVQQPKPKA